jgi:hypothetical protein
VPPPSRRELHPPALSSAQSALRACAPRGAALLLRIPVRQKSRLLHAILVTPSSARLSGNPLRVQLLRYPEVLFAGYRLPHPLETKLTLKIQVPRARARAAPCARRAVRQGSPWTAPQLVTGCPGQPALHVTGWPRWALLSDTARLPMCARCADESGDQRARGAAGRHEGPQD